jgi:hypothetical protein
MRWLACPWPFIRSALSTACENPEISTSTTPPSLPDWAAWGVNVVGLGVGAVSNASGKFTGAVAQLWEFYSPSISVAPSGFGVMAYAVQYSIDDGSNPSLSAQLGFASNLFSTVPGLVNLLKDTGPIRRAFVVAIDVICGAAEYALDIASLFEGLQLLGQGANRLQQA